MFGCLRGSSEILDGSNELQLSVSSQFSSPSVKSSLIDLDDIATEVSCFCLNDRVLAPTRKIVASAQVPIATTKGTGPAEIPKKLEFAAGLVQSEGD